MFFLRDMKIVLPIHGFCGRTEHEGYKFMYLVEKITGNMIVFSCFFIIFAFEKNKYFTNLK